MAYSLPHLIEGHFAELFLLFLSSKHTSSVLGAEILNGLSDHRGSLPMESFNEVCPGALQRGNTCIREPAAFLRLRRMTLCPSFGRRPVDIPLGVGIMMPATEPYTRPR